MAHCRKVRGGWPASCCTVGTRGVVELAVDLVGGTLAQAVLPALRRAGRSPRSPSPVLDLDQILDDNVTVHGVLNGDDGDRTRKLAALLADGALRAVISHVLPLAAAAQAHRIVASGHDGGKIVLDVSDGV
jgi:NADPH:quinone reductase